MQKFKDYFESEMRSLNELGEQFANSFPEQAGRLKLNSIKDRDPYVERLLEGVAFLTGQIRQRIDDCVPEISEAVLDQLCGSLIRPYPSTAILEFMPSSYSSKATPIQRHHRVSASRVGPKKVNCTFSTVAQQYIQPITVVQVTNHIESNGQTELIIKLEKSKNIQWCDINFNKLEFYIHEDSAAAYALFQLLCSETTRVEASQETQPINFDSLKFCASKVSEEDNILPSDGSEHAAFGILHDYFCARERFLFVRLKTELAHQLNNQVDSIEFKVTADPQLPKDTRLSSKSLRLNCTSAVNLYKADAQVIRVDHKQSEYSLKTEANDPQTHQVYQITSVTSRDQVNGEQLSYQPVHKMRYRDSNERTFSSRFKKTVAESPAVYLSLDSKPPFNLEVVSTEVIQSNGHYTRRYVELNDINQSDSEIEKGIDITNVTRPTKPYSVPAYHDYQWQLISLLTIKLSSIDTAEKLKHLLSLFDWTEQIENERKIKSIESVSILNKQLFVRGVLTNLTNIELELVENLFLSEADAYLFARILHSFYCALNDLKHATETQVTLIPSGKVFTWRG